LEPRWLRTDPYYITIYVTWMGLIFNILGPFVALAVLNHITYRKIMDFETRLTSGFGIGLTANVRCHPPKSGPNHENGNRNGSVVSNLHPRQTSVVISSTGVSTTATNTSGNDRRPRNASLNPDQIVRIDSSERIQLNELTREQNSRRSNNSSRISEKNSKKHVTPRRREVLLSKISLYIVYMFVCCHSVRLIPTVYELDWTYRQKKSDTDVMPWPTWVACVTNVSHFLLTLVCSSNFFIYYFKHGAICRSRANRAKRQNELGSPVQTQATTFQNSTIGAATAMIVPVPARDEILRSSSRLSGKNGHNGAEEISTNNQH